MLARHPLTGAPIKILNCENSIWRDQQTLVWLDGAIVKMHPNAAWSRYDIGVSSLEAAAALKAAGIQPDIVVPLGPTEDVSAWLQSSARAQARIVAVPRAVLEFLGQQAVIALRATNMVCLEECLQLYPFLETSWDNTEADARVMIATILRYGITCPVEQTTRMTPVRLLRECVPPPPLVLVTQYYRPPKAKRGREIDLCLRKNVACEYVDRVVLLNESDDVALPPDLSGNAKITTQSIDGRLNFMKVMRWIADEAPVGSYVAIANSDIYLDETWRTLWSFNMADKFLSLLRWNDDENGGEPTLFGPRADSQDTWVVAADSVKAAAAAGKIHWPALDIPFGKGGCDNAINVEMLKLKFLVANPALTLRTHHVHWSEIRTYNPRDIVERPFYMHIHPTGIHDLKPEMNMDPATLAHKVEQPAFGLDIGVSASLTATQLRTFQTMVAKAYPTIAAAGFAVTPVTIPVYTLRNVFQNKDGLVSAHDKIYIGKSKAAAAAWSAVELSKVAPCVQSDCAFAVPCPDSVCVSPATYCLKYLGKVLALRALTGDEGEFLAPPKQAFVDTLGLFSWPPGELPVLRREENFNTYCRKAHVWLPQDDVAAWPTTAEVDALRGALRQSWEPVPASKRSIVAIMDSHWITPALIDSLEQSFLDGTTIECITEDTPFPSVVSAMLGASGLVFANTGRPLWQAAWALPKGAMIWEVQFEMSPSLEVAHFSRVAGLHHSLMIMPRLKPAGQDAAIFDKNLHAALRSPRNATPSHALLPSKPAVYVPSADTTGFFAHAGDSFREMLTLWRDRGYITLEPRSGLRNVWLGAVGSHGVLLYDRPTMEWLNRSPIAEKAWRLALFGNPNAKGATKAAPWFFWPRRPAVVERLVSLGIGTANWLGRSRGLVFYGRSENAVQAARRPSMWAAAAQAPIDEFIHLEGEQPYPLTHEEYLVRLSTARFGLCLAGYGYKCHREIECMAMGCVPVVAPEVDMTSYAVPPQEGIHYLRAANPEAAVAAMAAITPERWSQMSAAGRAWWRANASVEGSWELTRRLVTSPL